MSPGPYGPFPGAPADPIDVGDLGEHITHPSEYDTLKQRGSGLGAWFAIGLACVAALILLGVVLRGAS